MGRLGHTGTSLAFKRELFKEGFGGQVMLCILASWRTMTLHRSVRHETCITALLSDELNAAFLSFSSIISLPFLNFQAC